MPDRQPVRLPLVIGPENRDETTNRDARLVNGFLEKISEESVMVFKRPGLEVYSNSGTPAAEEVNYAPRQRPAASLLSGYVSSFLLPQQLHLSLPAHVSLSYLRSRSQALRQPTRPSNILL